MHSHHRSPNPYQIHPNTYGRQYNRYGTHQNKMAPTKVYRAQKHSSLSRQSLPTSNYGHVQRYDGNPYTGKNRGSHRSRQNYSLKASKQHNPFKGNDEQSTNRYSRYSPSNGRNYVHSQKPVRSPQNRRVSHHPPDSRSGLKSPLQQKYGSNGVVIHPQILRVDATSKKINNNTVEIEIDHTISVSKIESSSQLQSPRSSDTLPKSPNNGRDHSRYSVVNKIDIPVKKNIPDSTMMSTPNRYTKTVTHQHLSSTERSPSTVQKVMLPPNLRNTSRCFQNSPSRVKVNDRLPVQEYFTMQSPRVISTSRSRVISPGRTLNQNCPTIEQRTLNGSFNFSHIPGKIVHTEVHSIQQSLLHSPSSRNVYVSETKTPRISTCTQSTSAVIAEHSLYHRSPNSSIQYNNYYVTKSPSRRVTTTVIEHPPRLLSTKLYLKNQQAYCSGCCCHHNHHKCSSPIIAKTRIEPPPRILSANVHASPIRTKVQKVSERATPKIKVKQEIKEPESKTVVLIRENREMMNRVQSYDIIEKMREWSKPLKPNLGAIHSPRKNSRVKQANRPIRFPNSYRVKPRIKRSHPAVTKPETTYYPDHPDDRSSILLYIINKKEAESDMEVEQEHEIDHFFLDKQNKEHTLTTTIVSRSKKQKGHLMVSPPHVKIILDGEFVSESTPLVNEEEFLDESGNEIFYGSQKNINEGIKIHQIEESKNSLGRLDSKISFAGNDIHKSPKIEDNYSTSHNNKHNSEIPNRNLM